MEQLSELLRRSQTITVTEQEVIMQACSTDMLPLHDVVFLLEPCDSMDGGARSTNDPAKKEMFAKNLRRSTDESRFERHSFQQEFDSDHELEELTWISKTYEEVEKKLTENELDKALKGEHFDKIKENVTPKILSSCKTNALLKAFEVKKKLKDLPDSGGAERNELELLVNSLDEFTAALIHPLKSDHDSRSTFRSCLDAIMEKVIDTEQKKFISHPVIYNLLESKWYGSFTSMRKGSWTSSSYWKYIFLNLWAVFDFILFPFLLAFFFIIRQIKVRTRKATEREVCFVVSLSGDVTDEVFSLIKRTISYTIHQYSCNSANYCVILREDSDEDNTSTNISFEEDCPSEPVMIKRVNELRKSNAASPWLYDDLCAACDAFKSPYVRIESEKVLVVFVNNLRSVAIDSIHEKMEEIREMGVRLVTVGFGEQAKQSELENIAKENALHFEEFELASTLGTAIIQALEGKDIYELYLDYFTTPYFLFFRDTLSSVVLLGLLFAICLQASTITFSRLEYAISLFFLGRIVTEVNQFTNSVKAGKQEVRSEYKSLRRRATSEDCSGIDPSGQNVVLRKFANYFSDRWNMLDFIIVSIYVTTFTLRMITWGISTEVPGNRLLAVAGYLYGLIALLLTLRAFGHVMEVARGMGAIQIAVFVILKDLRAIFWLFIATILGFSLAMTKVFVVEKSFGSLNGSDKHQECEISDSFSCWWTIAEHLAWSLLGMSSRDLFKSDDRSSKTLSYLLYTLFLVLAVILLINLLIALLSNTYQQVQNNSLREWSFKKAVTINTYSACHPVPIPFNLISIPLVALTKLCQRCFFKRKFFEKQGVDEEGRDAALDQLVLKLQRTYFATYGYLFPLTDERKMDQLLHETDGNRQMANQIIRQLFTRQGYEQETFNSSAYAWQSLGIGIEGCLLTYEGPNSCYICELRNDYREHHGAQCLTPFTPEMPRFEVLIQESGERRIVGVGVVYQGYNCHCMPGWVDGTVGYHADDGKIFEPRHHKSGREVTRDATCMAYRGDVMACEVEFDEAKYGTIPIVFFKNSQVVERSHMKYTAGRTELFPYVAMGFKGIRVLAKMCPRDKRQAQSSAAVQHMRDLALQEKLDALREEMTALENRRREETKEFEEKLLNEIQKLGRATCRGKEIRKSV